MAPFFPDFRKIRKRIKRTLNYGIRQPTTLNLSLSEFVVEYFDQKCTFDYMEPETSTSISKKGYADPCSLIVALVYLDRLRLQNKQFFESTDPTELYVPALLLASKYLHDADTYDRVSNSEWAESLEMNAEELNVLEWNFIKNLDWNVAVKKNEFENYLERVEHWAANSFVIRNQFMTYNEFLHLSESIPIMDVIKKLVEVITTTSFIYCLTIAFMTSTVNQLTRSTKSPDSVNCSADYLVVPINYKPADIDFTPTPSSMNDVFDFQNRIEGSGKVDCIFENVTLSRAANRHRFSEHVYIEKIRAALQPIFFCYQQNFQFIVK